MVQIKHGAMDRGSRGSITVVNKPIPLGGGLTNARDEAGWYPYQQSKWTPWEMVWSADVSFPPVIGNGLLVAKYLLKDGPTIEWKIGVQFGSTTNGGRGPYSFSLPYPVSDGIGAEQNGDAKAFTTGGANWDGFTYCTAGLQVARPFFAFNSGVSFYGQAQNADLTGAVGTGVPLVAGNFTWTNGFNFFMWGTYEPDFG